MLSKPVNRLDSIYFFARIAHLAPSIHCSSSKRNAYRCLFSFLATRLRNQQNSDINHPMLLLRAAAAAFLNASSDPTLSRRQQLQTTMHHSLRKIDSVQGNFSQQQCGWINSWVSPEGSYFRVRIGEVSREKWSTLAGRKSRFV